MTFERAAECESIGGQDYDCDSAWPKEAIRGKRLKDGKKSVHFDSCNNRFSSEKWGLSKRNRHVYVHGASVGGDPKATQRNATQLNSTRRWRL